MTDPRQRLVEDLQTIAGHDLDAATMFCRRCGMRLQDIVERDQSECHAGPNVVAISHIAAGRRLRALVGAFVL